jgi:hypothetical protein
MTDIVSNDFVGIEASIVYLQVRGVRVDGVVEHLLDATTHDAIV